jgi:hypothetical protein
MSPISKGGVGEDLDFLLFDPVEIAVAIIQVDSPNWPNSVVVHSVIPS